MKPVETPGDMRDGTFVIGYVGAFVPWHRLDMLIDAACVLAPAYPHARWLLVGDGVERPRVESLLAERGLVGKFWMPGAVAHRFVPSYVSVMDVAVMPHSNVFGSPMKLFEYMAMARAVVVPDVPAIREVIQDGVNGLLFRAGDPSAFCESLRRLLEEDELRRRLGERARQDVLEKHTWMHNARRVMDGVERCRRRQEVTL